jgi:hypothetical protein
MRLRQGFAKEIVAADPHAIAREGLKQARIEVDRQYRARVAHAFGEQSRRRAGARPHVETAPPLGHPDRVELPHTVRIAELLEEREAGSLELLGSLLAERVLDHPHAEDTCAGARDDGAS